MIVDISNLTVNLKDGAPLACLPKFQVARGEAVGWIGKSGYGKTSLLRGIISSALQIRVDDYAISSRQCTSAVSCLGYQSQKQSLVPWVTIGRFFQMMEPEQDCGEKLSRNTLEILEEFCIDKLLERFPRDLSGGEYQRCALAGALIRSPDLILLDEPLTEVHSQLRWRIFGYMLRWLRSEMRSMVLVSHDIDTIAFLANRVTIFHSNSFSNEDLVFRSSEWTTWSDFISSTEHRDRYSQISAALLE